MSTKQYRSERNIDAASRDSSIIAEAGNPTMGLIRFND